jgi:hypothetical protein
MAGRKKKALLERMRANAKGDWTISDIETVCGQIGIELRPPSNGSHYKAYSEHLEGMLTIPANRPIKPVYIRTFVRLADAHIRAMETIKKEADQ